MPRISDILFFDGLRHVILWRSETPLDRETIVAELRRALALDPNTPIGKTLQLYLTATDNVYALTWGTLEPEMAAMLNLRPLETMHKHPTLRLAASNEEQPDVEQPLS